MTIHVRTCRKDCHNTVVIITWLHSAQSNNLAQPSRSPRKRSLYTWYTVVFTSCIVLYLPNKNSNSRSTSRLPFYPFKNSTHAYWVVVKLSGVSPILQTTPAVKIFVIHDISTTTTTTDSYLATYLSIHAPQKHTNISCLACYRW